MVELPSPLLDIGTGCGFPGVPLKIAHPDLEVVLAEKRQKLIRFLNILCSTLQLAGLEIYPHNVGRQFRRPIRGVVTRALESMSGTLRRVYYFLPPGGKVFFMKGLSGADELAATQIQGQMN
jgi:16S rRNA (guanine527-N7)-methyltransferase